MTLRDWHPRLAPDYRAAARTYALDIAAAAILFAASCAATGRVWRYPFDDELLTRAVAHRTQSALEFALFFLKGGDVHPPLAFFGYYGLLRLGFADWGMRLVSVGLTATAFALFHVLCLGLLRQRSDGTPPVAVRLMAIVLFGLCPMAISQGDAIRWYPLFAMLVALSIVFYVAADNGAARVLSAAMLGLAASTNFLALFVGLALMLYRYGLERRFRWRCEAAYWGVAAVFATPGLVTAYSIAAHHWPPVHDHVFAAGAVRSVAITLLGLLGGTSIGVGNAWLIAPALVIWPLALYAAIAPTRPADPLHLLLAMLAAIPAMTLAGFSEPRSFLYLMPMMLTILVMYIDRQCVLRGPRRGITIFVLLLVTATGALANIRQTTRPFKRNAVVPFAQIVDFIAMNAQGRTLILSTDPVLASTLQSGVASSGRCASYFMQQRACFEAGAVYDTVFVVSGHSNRSRLVNYMDRYAATVGRWTEGKRMVASMPAGLDEDAALKEWLTATPLDRYILTVDVFK